MADCDPGDYLKRIEHSDICDRRHEAAMDWAHEAVKAGEVDRMSIKTRVDKLEAWKDKLFWVILLAAIGIIATNLIGPRLARNGDSKILTDMQTKINIVVDKQATFDTILNDVREDQRRREKREK